MNTLVLMPGSRALSYALYQEQTQLYSGNDRSFGNRTSRDVAFAVRLLKVTLAGKVGALETNLIAVRMSHGGTEFTGPARFDAVVRAKLESLIPLAPSRMPIELQLLDRVKECYPSVPIILLFETSFFTALPSEEYLYGIPVDLSNELLLRRFGLHGLFHESTCLAINRDWHSRKEHRRPHILSICLDAKPEVAACVGLRPVMSTGGVSALEGIPGQHICGELDAGVVLRLARHFDWAPEKISDVLTKDSGLCALAEREVTIADVLDESDQSLALARDVLRYRLLQACGAGVAVMHRLDAIGYSGRFVAVAPKLHRWLLDNLPARVVENVKSVEPTIVSDGIQSILVERALQTFETTRSFDKTAQAAFYPAVPLFHAGNGGPYVHT